MIIPPSSTKNILLVDKYF